MIRFRRALAFAAAVALCAPLAHAQLPGGYNASLPAVVPVQNLNQGDLAPVAQGGVGSVPTQFANVGLIGGMVNIEYKVPLTAFTITPPNNITMLFLKPAGTLATGTITFPALPSSGEQFCWMSTHTQTGVTMAANTGQSIVGSAVTAGVAGTSYCWRYIAQTATWYRTL